MSLDRDRDVIVVGAGNAGLVAALAAADLGARVLVLEAAPRAERGGNSRFSGGIFRLAHEGLDSLRPLLAEHAQVPFERLRVDPYTAPAYAKEWDATSRGHADAQLTRTVIERSADTLRWMRDRGVEWELTADKLWDPDKIDPSRTYSLPPGAAVRAVGEGVGLMERLFAAVERNGIEVWYDAPAHGLVMTGSAVEGVRVRRRDRFEDVRGAVVLACGGFEANPEMRLRYLGEGWDLVKVRGTRFNMGTMLRRALEADAQPAGHWGGAHATPIDAAAPPTGDLALTDKMSRYSYPYAILVDRGGDRFVDEGEAQVFLTYAKTGAAIRSREGGVAFQVFDQRTIHLLEPRYATGTPVQADTLDQLAARLGMPAARLARTVAGYNDSVSADADARFDPFTTDGVSASPPGQPRKSNWALRVDRPPYVAYAVACGITFTYGGLKVDATAHVLDTEGRPMDGLYAAGEITGDFFYFNYPGGAGLMRGAVFGRIAGANAVGVRTRAST